MSTLEAFLPLFEPETLAKLVSKKAFAAGVELFEVGRTVTDIVFDSGCLRGKVKGSQPVPHVTTLKLQPDGALAFRRLPGSRHRRIRIQDAIDIAAERDQRRAGGDAIRAALGE